MAFFGDDSNIRDVALALLEKQKLEEKRKQAEKENEFLKLLNSELRAELDSLKT